MQTVNNNKGYKAEADVLESIVQKLNTKFDEGGFFNNHIVSGSRMFEGYYRTGGNEAESWGINFLGRQVFSGGSAGSDNMSECMVDGYITLEKKNEQKIFMIATSNAISFIEKLMYCISNADVSQKNKEKWLSILKEGIENDSE